MKTKSQELLRPLCNNQTHSNQHENAKSNQIKNILLVLIYFSWHQ